MNRRPAAVLAGLALGLSAACGDADNTYVEEEGSGLFLRLPEHWTVFPVESGDPAADPRVDLDFGPWRVVIDGSQRPDRSHAEEPVPDEPVGTVDIVPLALFQAPPPLAHASLRAFFTVDGTDPLESAEIEDIEYDEIDLGHHWGNKLVGTMRFPGTRDAVRVAQLAFFDSGGKRLHVVRIMCSLDCFEEREDEIEDVLDSLTLEDR